MTTQLINQLNAPFYSADIDWREEVIAPGQIQLLPYLQSRAVQHRLDDVMGLNWSTRYQPTSRGLICELSLYINGQWITRSDAADMTALEPTKGGASNALKRAAAQFGIGRYLYDMPAIIVAPGTVDAKSHQAVRQIKAMAQHLFPKHDPVFDKNPPLLNIASPAGLAPTHAPTHTNASPNPQWVKANNNSLS